MAPDGPAADVTAVPGVKPLTIEDVRAEVARLRDEEKANAQRAADRARARDAEINDLAAQLAKLVADHEWAKRDLLGRLEALVKEQREAKP